MGSMEVQETRRFHSHAASRSQRKAVLAEVFRPAAPISTRDLFAGRHEQVSELLSVVSQPGQHGVIFGERGVGKTSLALATGMAAGFSAEQIAVRVNCDTSDSFDAVWRKAFGEITFLSDRTRSASPVMQKETLASAKQLLDDAGAEISPDDVRRVLQTLAIATPVVIFIDEFDRLPKNGHHALFADTIKTLSDQLVDATVIFVGVADNVNDLISEHSSIERALVQVPMPRMSPRELGEIVTRGYEAAEMTSTSEAMERISLLSQGLPHYTHMLGQQAGYVAVREGRSEVNLDDVDAAVTKAMTKAQQSIQSDYYLATFSTRSTLYKQVLLGCALAGGDDFGFFSAADVRSSLSAIMGQRYEIPAFAQHLHELADPRRGSVLEKRGESRRFKFRFRNPLLQPYIVMRGLSEEIIDGSMLSEAAAMTTTRDQW